MNKENVNQNTNAPQLWSRWGTESQVILLFSALASGAITSADAQTIEVPAGTTVTTPVLLDEDGQILNNNGEINLSLIHI